MLLGVFLISFTSAEGEWINANFSSSPCNEPTAIESNGTHILVADYNYDGVCRYYMNGTYMNQWTFTTGHNNPYDLASDGTYLWNVDVTDSRVYKYYLNGTYINYFSTTGASSWGLDYYEGYLYLIRTDDVYKYYDNGTLSGTVADLSGQGLANSYGLTNDGTYFYVLDSNDKNVSRYYINWTYSNSYFNIPQVSTPYSITHNETNFLILSYDTDKWLLYNKSSEEPPLPEGQINVTSISDNSSSSQPKQNQSIIHKAYWQTNATSLSTYIFSWNNSGSFVNSTPVTFTGSANWSNVTMNVTNVSGTNIGWIIYANDSENKWNNTGIQEYLIKSKSEIYPYEYYTTGIDNQIWVQGGESFAQTFTVGTVGNNESFYLTNITLQLYKHDSPGNINLSIFETNSTGHPSLPVLTSLIFNGADLTTSAANYTFNFTTTPLLEAGKTYAIVLLGVTNWTNAVGWKIDATSPTYSGGLMYLSENGGTTWANQAYDAFFITYGRLEEEVIPGSIYSQSEGDNSSATYPKYFNFVKHWVEWVTNATSLSTYIFSWNNSGSWENLSTTEFGASNWSNVTTNITAVKDSNIGWWVWVNDSEGKVNYTSIKEYLVRNSLPTSSIGMFNETGIIFNGTPVKVNVSIGDLDGLSDIDTVIATIQKNISSGVGTGNTTPLNMTYYPTQVLPVGGGGVSAVEISPLYEDGVVHVWYRNYLPTRIAYANSTNGVNFTDLVNVSIPQMETINRQLEYVIKVNSTYYMFMANFTGAESTHNLIVFNSTDKINWEYACPSVITNTGYQKNPAVWYNESDGVWHGLFEQGSGTFKVYYWNSTNLCSTWTRYAQQFGSNAGNADIHYSETNKSFVVFYGDMTDGTNQVKTSVAVGTNLNQLSIFHRNLLTPTGAGFGGTFASDPGIVIIDDGNESFYSPWLAYFAVVPSGDDARGALAYDSQNRTFDESFFGTTIGYNENLTLSQVGSTSEWSGTFTNTSYIGMYNLTTIYVNDTDNAWNTSTYSTISFTTETGELDNSSCDVYFNTTSPITYPNRFTVYTNCSSDYTLYRNGTSISNGTSIDGAGYYNLSVVRTNQGSYNNIFDDEFFTINTFDDGCSIFFNETSPVYYPNTFTVWTNCSTGTLRRNNTEITNNSEQDLTYGVYNFSFQRTDTQNYTTNYIDEYFEISDNTPPTINVTVPQTSNYVFFTNYTNGIYGYFPYTSYFINWTSYDDNLDTCWFENISSLNFMIRVNETVTCNANATIVYPVSTGNTLRFYANDTYGNIVSAVRTNITNDMRIDRSEYYYINTTTQGNIVNFWMNTRKTTADSLENVTFVLNNTNYPITDISGTNFSTNVTIPSITGNTTYYWEFDFGEGFFNSTIYNITIGASPVITINSPTNSTYYLTSASPNVTINFSVADDNFVNATYNVNGTNMTSLSNETQINLNLSTGIYNLYVWAIDGNGFIDYETLVFSVKNLNQLTPTYTSSIYETQGTSYIVNLTDLYNTNLSAVTLFVNGSSYTPTQSGYLWNYTRQSPANYLNNVSLIWQLTYSGVNYNTTTYYQLINPINFGLCNATYTVPYLNLSFKDEATNISMNATIQSSTFVYYLGNGTANKTVYYSTSSNYTDYRFCFLPGNLTYYIYPSVSYNLGTDYPLRTWNPATKSYTNSTTNQTLYLLSTSTGSYVTFQVVNSADQPLSNVNVNATRLIDGISTVVAQGTTDSAGSIQFWLNPDYLHTFMFSKSGYTTFTTSLFPTEAEYTITLGGSSSSSGGTATDYTRGIKLFVYPKSKELQNDTTYRFIFNMTSSYWDVDEYGFSLRLSNGTIIGTDTEVTEESGTSISYNVNNQSIIYMDYYYDIDGNYINNTVRWVVTNSLNTDWSIKTLVEDANTYMDSGLFGLDNFGRLVISFLLLFLVVGIVGYKYGVVSPFFMSVLTFAVVFFLDVITGILPAVRGVEHLLTYVAGLIALLVVVWDLTR